MKKITVLLTAAFVFAAIVSMPSTTAASVMAKTGSPQPLATPEKRLNDEEVGALLDDLRNGLSDQITDAETIDAIGERWDAHQDLAGKTRTQILTVLFADVRSIVTSKATRDDIWASWNDDDDPEDADPAPEGNKAWIKLVHRGVYLANFDVTWDEPGKAGRSFHAVNKDNSFQQTLSFPGGTKHIRVHIANVTGLAWEPTRDLINRSLAAGELNKCLVLDGTALRAGMQFEDCDTSASEGKPAPVPAGTETWIGLSHEGAYTAHFDVTWNEPGKPNQTYRADQMNGYNHTLKFARGASNIRVKITNDTGLAWEPTREIINRALTDAEINKCLVIDGTTLSSKIRFETCDD